MERLVYHNEKLIFVNINWRKSWCITWSNYKI